MLLLKRGGLTRVLPGASCPRLGMGSTRVLIPAPVLAVDEESWRFLDLPRSSPSAARPPVLPSALSIATTGSRLSSPEWVKHLFYGVMFTRLRSQWRGVLPGLLPCCPGQGQHKIC
ncbi:hypothetical protein NDU88_001925 [Pleurodeles waltl]|uniref:Uncharacterized protein n=1 Tax=Pleurodeles waltl TaxID=8319 RepID=A0AAV7LB53_PLEWA|nr:hypothetical protein NDU88_001925 [Pleurodeles waltl]